MLAAGLPLSDVEVPEVRFRPHCRRPAPPSAVAAARDALSSRHGPCLTSRPLPPSRAVGQATVKHHARDPSLTEVHFPTTFWRSEWLPAESQTACAQLVMPHHPRPDVPVLRAFPHLPPLGQPLRLRARARRDPPADAVLLPGTGEQWYRRRREGIALPLAQEGVATLILEGPFYGQRRPAHQFGSKLRQCVRRPAPPPLVLSHAGGPRSVSDLPMLGAATIAEARSLLVWLRRHVTTGPLVVGGTSMGGLHAAMTASLIDMPVGIASWLGPPSATPPFTSGALGGCTEWSILEDDVARSGIDAVCRNAPWRLEGAYEECAEGGRAQRLMVEFLNVSDISHFPRPRAPSAARFFVAKDDMYLPPRSVAPHWDTLTRRWGTPPVEWVDGGHVAATLFKRRQFRDAVCSIARHLRGLR